MKKSDVITSLRQQKVVAVIRGDDYDTGLKTCEACIKGGLTVVEMAFSNNAAGEIIKTLADSYRHSQEVMIGAGTVLDAATARMAILAGASFVVSPSFDLETALLCNSYNVPYMPGCMTLTEIMTAMKYGSEIVKIFPGNTLGIPFIQAVKAPLPHASMMVTGGVDIDNINDWFDAGVDAVGIGGELNKLGAEGNYEAVVQKAHEYVLKVRG